MLATTAQDDFTRVWEVAIGREVARLHAGAFPIFSPDSKWLAAGASVWEVATRRELFRENINDYLNNMVFSPDGKWYVIATGSI